MHTNLDKNAVKAKFAELKEKAIKFASNKNRKEGQNFMVLIRWIGQHIMLDQLERKEDDFEMNAASYQRKHTSSPRKSVKTKSFRGSSN